MPIYNETFESFRKQTRKIEKAISLLCDHDYKIIDPKNELISKQKTSK